MKSLLAPLDPDAVARRARESVLDDVAPWRGASEAEHAAGLFSVVAAADALVAASPDGWRFRQWQDPRSPEAEALWRRLVGRRT